MKVNLKMIWHMVLVSLYNLIRKFMKVIGIIICLMAKRNNHSIQVQNILGILKMEQKMVMASTSGLIRRFTKVNGKMINYLEKVFIFMLMELNIMDHGKTIKNTDSEFYLTQMVENTPDNFTKAKNTVKVYTIGRTGKHTTENSNTVNFMEKHKL